jgi:hypothetical protein
MALPQALAKWWQNWTAGNRFENCSDWDVEQMAKDIGVSSDELRRLASLGEDSADLLLARMAALHLDRSEVSASVPEILQDLRRVCSFCKDHRRCALDLARNSADPAWKQYCPNVGTLLALDAMPWAARKEW